MSDIAIKVNQVSKVYRLYERQRDRLKDALNLTRKKCYREHFALDQLDFEIKKGETVGIIGTNGSGKSTILKIITGVLNPSGGNVEVDGRISALLELGAGFNMEYTGIENVYLNGTMIGFTKEEIDERLNDILAFADIAATHFVGILALTWMNRYRVTARSPNCGGESPVSEKYSGGCLRKRYGSARKRGW